MTFVGTTFLHLLPNPLSSGMFPLCSIRTGASMMMTRELTPDEWLDGMERKLSGLNALRVMVEGPPRGQLDPVGDGKTWVHAAFHTYRSGMGDNDPALPRIARIEHDFIAALSALNFDDQTRQLRLAMRSLWSFHHAKH